MNLVQRALRTLTGWAGLAGPYVDVGPPHLPAAELPDGCGNSWAAAASLPALLRCIALYADQLATLPRAVVRRDARSALETDATSDAARALAGTSYVDWEGAALACALTGNGYLRIPRNDRGGPLPLRWIPTARVSVETDERQRVWYRVAADYALQEAEALLPEADVVHLRFRMMAGNRVMGTSPAMLCAPALALAVDARALQRELLGNLNAPLFVMTSPGKISPETANRLASEWETNFSRRVRGRFRTAFVGEGLKPEGVPLADAQKLAMVETFQFCTSEIARAYGVPAALLDETGAQTSANSAEAMRAFASTSLQPFTSRVADELTRKVVNFGAWRVEFDLANLLQSPSEQADRIVRYLNAGALSLNEVRASLGLAPVDGGDAIRAPVNVAPLDRWLAGMPQAPQEPGHEDVPGVSDPEGGDGAQDQKRLRVVT